MFDGEDVLRREGNIRGAGIVAQVSNFPRPRDRHDILAFAHHPGKGNLRKGRVIAGGHLLKALKQQLVFAHGFGLEARQMAAEIIRCQNAGIGNCPRQEAAAKRAVWHKADPQLAAGVENIALRLAAP